MADFSEVVNELKKNRMLQEGANKRLQNIADDSDDAAITLRMIEGKQGQLVKETKEVAKETKKAAKETQEAQKGLTDGIGNIVKNDISGGVKKIGETITAPMKSFASAIPGLGTLGKVAGQLGANAKAQASGAKATEDKTEQNIKDKKRETLLETIGDGILQLNESFLNGLGKLADGGKMGLGVIAGAILAPVVALSAFFVQLKKEFAILKTFTGGGLAKLGNLLRTFFTTLDTVVFGPEGAVLQTAGQKIMNLFNSIGNILGKLNPMNIPGMAKVGDAITDAVSFVTKMINGIKTALAPVKTGFLAMDAAMGVFRPIMSFAKTLGTVLGKIFLPITVLMSVFDFVTGFMDGYDKDGVIGGIEGGITKLLQGLIGMPLDLLKGAVSFIGDMLGFDMSFMDGFSFSELIGDAIGFIFDMLKGAVNWIGTLFTDPIAALQALWDGLLGGYDSIMSFITWPIDAAINWVMGLFGWSNPEGEEFSLWGTIKSALMKVWEWLAGLFSFDLGNAIEGLLPSWTPGWVRSALGLGGGDDEEDETSPPKPMSAEAMQAYRDELAAAKDRLTRSIGGENVYTGPDALGQYQDSQMIEQIEAILAEADAKARGGPLKKGIPTLVGEHGPELIFPTNQGQVMNASRTANLLNASSEYDSMGRASGGAPVVVNNAPTTVTNTSSRGYVPMPISDNSTLAWNGTTF